MSNLFYRNTNAKISFEVLDYNNNPIGLSATSVVKYYILSPDNIIYSNDPDVLQNTYNNGIGSLIANPVIEDQPGNYYINYVLTKVGDYRYKFQINDVDSEIDQAVSGTIKVITDGIF